MSVASSVAAPVVRSCVRSVLDRRGGQQYPKDAILYYDADKAPYTELVRGQHTFNHAVLSPQWQLNGDGSYSNVGAKPAVDVFGGQKWLRSCGAVTNLLPGDTSQARSVSLTAQTYTLQVFGAGTVTCSYGTASVGTPRTFTATAGSTTFTPSGATLWMLTNDPFPEPYVPPGTTMPASNATTTNGSWFALPVNSPVWQALTGQPLTLATRVRMGVGSGDLPNSTTASLFAASNNTGPLEFRKTGGGLTWFQCWDGSSGTNSPAFVFQRGQIVRAVCQINTAGSQFRIGHFVEGTHTAIQWGSWANYDSSFNPSTLYRLMLGFNNPHPMWFNKIAIWKQQVADAAIMEALS